MRKAVIDVGTNSTRLLVADYLENEIIPVYSGLEMARIGEGLAKTGIIGAKPLERTLNCLEKFIDKCREFKVQQIRIAATSAVRDAQNKEEVRKKVKRKTGLDLEVLTGTEEARLSYLGAISGVNEDVNNVFVLDIGGGSTELIYTNHLNVITYKSINLGAVRLKDDPFLMDEAEKLIDGLYTDLLPENFILIGVGGTATTLAAIKLGLEKYDPDLVHGHDLHLTEIKQMYNLLKSMNLLQRERIKGLQPKRADIIVYGIFILLLVMQRLKTEKLKVSERDILYGMIISS
ncbi:MAG: Ppx/GppA family phosphatase [Bacillota bacterium]